MYLTAKVYKSDTSSFWLAECPDLDLMTQGMSQDDAKLMLNDAIRCILPKLVYTLYWLDYNAGIMRLYYYDADANIMADMIAKREDDAGVC